MAKTSPLVYVALIAVLAVGYWAFTQPQTPVPLPQASIEPSQPSAIDQPAPPQVAGSGTQNRGTLSFSLTSSLGATGTTSNMLLLNPSKHAIMGADGKLDKPATRYALMRIHQEKGIDGMTSFTSSGAPQALAASSGSWSTTVSGKVGDQVLVYTYQDTTPARGENISAVNLVTLSDFYRETGTWVAQTEDGKDAWQLYNYGTVNFTDANDVNKSNYTYFDSGSALTDKTITFYSQAFVQGEECVDCSVYIVAPSNYTSRFKSLSVTDNFGNNVKFDALAGKAENFVGPVNTASTVIASNGVSDHYIYYVGSIAGLNTMHTSADANRLTWVLKSDTYGEAGRTIPVVIHVVQNSGGLIKNNGAFEVAGGNSFRIGLDGAANVGGVTSGFNAQSSS